MTSTPESLEKLLTELSGAVDPTNPSPQLRSDGRAFWMALAVLCPEKHRLEFEKQRKAGEINDYGIAGTGIKRVPGGNSRYIIFVR